MPIRVIALFTALLALAGPIAAGDTEFSFELKRAAEAGLTMTAHAPGTSWKEPGAEAAVVRLDLDGRYSQHVTLFLGAGKHEYRVLLGPVAAGKHILRATLDRRLSSRLAREFEASFRVVTFEPGSPDYDALAQAPFVYARPDTLGRATDVAMLAWYEWLPAAADAPPGASRMLQYTWVFSNEDGGTNTPALMARWGRAVDIEHVYRVFLDDSGRRVGELYQGAKHKETPFRGRRLGRHPLLAVVTDNNNFSDRPQSRVRLALWPIAANLAEHSREEITDQHPWTYRVMAEELEREGKIAEIDDPRNYVYIEARIEPSGAAATFGVVLNDGREFRADVPRNNPRIERSGWVRSATRLPAGVTPGQVKAVYYICEPPGKPPPAGTPQFCLVSAISKVLFLDENYKPTIGPAVKGDFPARLSPGEKVAFGM